MKNNIKNDIHNSSSSENSDLNSQAPKKKSSLIPGKISLFPGRASIFPSVSSKNPPKHSIFPDKNTDIFKGSPSVPPQGAAALEPVEVRAPKEMRFLMVALLISIIIFSVFYWENFGVINQKLVIFFNLFIVIGTIDYFQKIYLFNGDSIERRILFKWFRYKLPDSFSVKRELSGGIVLIDDATNKVILAIGRDLVNNSMTNALKELYQYSESSFEIG